jgi:glutaredoxin
MRAWIRRFLPRRRQLPPVQVIVYTRTQCPLCDEAKHFLEGEQDRRGFALRFVDVDGDPELKAKYDDCVPVVEIDGKVRFRGKINPFLWARLW